MTMCSGEPHAVTAVLPPFHLCHSWLHYGELHAATAILPSFHLCHSWLHFHIMTDYFPPVHEREKMITLSHYDRPSTFHQCIKRGKMVTLSHYDRPSTFHQRMKGNWDWLMMLVSAPFLSLAPLCGVTSPLLSDREHLWTPNHKTDVLFQVDGPAMFSAPCCYLPPPQAPV